MSNRLVFENASGCNIYINLDTFHEIKHDQKNESFTLILKRWSSCAFVDSEVQTFSKAQYPGIYLQIKAYLGIN